MNKQELLEFIKRLDLSIVEGGPEINNCDTCQGIGMVKIDDGYHVSDNLLPCPECEYGQKIREEISERRHRRNKLPRLYTDVSFRGYPLQEGKILAFASARAIAEFDVLSSRQVGKHIQHMLKEKTPEFVKAMIDADETRPGLVLWGDYGVGKTYLMSCAINRFAERGRETRYVRYRDMVQEIRDTWRTDESTGELIDYLASVPVLFIDDLSDNAPLGDSVPDHVQAYLSSIFRRRLPNNLTTLITSNWSTEIMRHKIGDQAAESLFEGCHYVQMGGRSFRKTRTTIGDNYL